jgi:two-component system, cell cycle response regulator
VQSLVSRISNCHKVIDVARILLVDDEKVACTIYGDFLRGDAHDVSTAESIAEAQRLLEKEPFDLVVTDIMFPVGDGLSLLHDVKSKYPDIEVMVMTALDKVEPAVKAIRSGASDYLLKPLSPVQLHHAVERALNQQRLKAENASLRSHVLLMESGERLATTLDKDRLSEVSAHVYSRLCGVTRMAIFQGDELFMAPGFETPAPAWISEVPKLSEGKEHPIKIETTGELVWRIPLGLSEAQSSTLYAFFSSEPTMEAKIAVTLLSRHFSSGLSNLKQLNAVESLVYLDDLTRLFNARYLELMLSRECKSFTDGGKPFALLFIDIDGLKAINDAHGHLVGSKIIAEAARILKGCLRDTDVASRWGGDEFVILLRNTDAAGALVVAERIRSRIESQPFLAREQKRLSATVSIGVATAPANGTEKNQLLNAADAAMYQAKKAQKNFVVVAL